MIRCFSKTGKLLNRFQTKLDFPFDSFAFHPSLLSRMWSISYIKPLIFIFHYLFICVIILLGTINIRDTRNDVEDDDEDIQ